MKFSLSAAFLLAAFSLPQMLFSQTSTFDDYPAYTGKDLGLTFSPKKCTFKIWSPQAVDAMLHIYDDYSGFRVWKSIHMKKGAQGEWSATVKGASEGKFYNFQVKSDTGWVVPEPEKGADKTALKLPVKSEPIWLPETPDPYAVAVGTNGLRAQVVDLKKTNPPGWEKDRRPPLASPADVILYELHLRDISVHPASGIKNKGKYLALTETGTKTPGGESTGLDHLKDLGVTHVHILPVFDFLSVDESRLDSAEYNWGYDPQNYNTPEGSYSTNPADGAARIREFKQMVQALHAAGLRVVMDVVYNHTGATEQSLFNRLVPDYYYRKRETMGGEMWSNASGCGNETASERPMMRKFMIESMLHWAKEYHVDGFRVDLMAIHDIETLNLAAAELRKVEPGIFIYGEGWTAGDSPFDEQRRAVKTNVAKLDGIAAFSDEFRDGVKGHVFKPNTKGFASGETGLEESVKFGIVGGVKHPQVDNKLVNYSKHPWAAQPTQCVNYVSCHDNHTLWDRLRNSCPGEPEEERLKLVKLMQTIVFTSQGVPFLHAGEEFVRTKGGVENSFQSGDAVNQVNWSNKEKYGDLFDYHQALIRLRKNHPAFHVGSAEKVAANLRFLEIPFDNIIGYELNGAACGDSWKRILVLFNGNKGGKQVEIPAGNWKIVCQSGRIDEGGMGKPAGTKAQLLPRTALILAEE